MANRNFTQYQRTLERELVTICATIDFVGSTGNPVVKSWAVPATGGTGTYSAASALGYKGIKNVVYNGATGKWLLTLTENYVRLLGMDSTFVAIDGATDPTVSATLVLKDAVNALAAPQITFYTVNLSGTKTNPAANDRLLLLITLSNSTAQ